MLVSCCSLSVALRMLAPSCACKYVLGVSVGRSVFVSSRLVLFGSAAYSLHYDVRASKAHWRSSDEKKPRCTKRAWLRRVRLATVEAHGCWLNTPLSFGLLRGLCSFSYRSLADRVWRIVFPFLHYLPEVYCIFNVYFI